MCSGTALFIYARGSGISVIWKPFVRAQTSAVLREWLPIVPLSEADDDVDETDFSRPLAL